MKQKRWWFKVTSDNFTNKLSRSLSALERRHRRFMNLTLGADGLPADIPYRYITAIKRYPNTSQDFLADLFGIDKSLVARKTRKMEVSELITREPDPDNRRQYMLKLTDKGEETYLLIVKRSNEWEALITGGIEEADLITTSDVISRIIENLDKC